MPKWNQATEQVVWKLTAGMRSRRNEFLLRLLAPGPDDTVLDLGSEDGSQLASFYPYPHNITIADIEEAPLRKGVARFGFAGHLLLEPDAPIPVADDAFDLVYCNSVIEHVTTAVCADQRAFVRRSIEHQRRFADEIRRVGRGYFVQTPNLHFPIESHSLLPFSGYLSAKHDARLAKLLKRVWIKQWSGGAHLLTRTDMEGYFPEAEIVPERFFGLVKSWMAIVRPGNNQETS